jgi:predicted RNA binding protein YcfA (HicA-like mRNA interferase family)
VSYTRIIKLLRKVGYEKDRQSSSHIIMKASAFNSHCTFDEVTVVAHNPVAYGTLLAILKDVSEQTSIPVEDLKRTLEDL